MSFRRTLWLAPFCLLACCSQGPSSSIQPSEVDPVEIAPPVLVEPEPVAVPIPVPPPVIEIATPEELKPLRLEYPPRFRACESYRDEIAAVVRKHWGIYQFPDAWAGQIYQESLCNPHAISPAGAQGIAQIMPATFGDISDRLNLPPGSTPFDRLAIEWGAYYQASMMRYWRSQRPEHERWRLGLGSYNAGAGSLTRAQRLCNGARDWRDIQPCLRQVTGERNSHETSTYVERIERWWRSMGACAPLAAPRGLQDEWGC